MKNNSYWWRLIWDHLNQGRSSSDHQSVSVLSGKTAKTASLFWSVQNGSSISGFQQLMWRCFYSSFLLILHGNEWGHSVWGQYSKLDIMNLLFSIIKGSLSNDICHYHDHEPKLIFKCNYLWIVKFIFHLSILHLLERNHGEPVEMLLFA